LKLKVEAKALEDLEDTLARGQNGIWITTPIS